VPIYENANLKSHLHLNDHTLRSPGSVYLEHYLGKTDTHNFRENRKRSMLYKERILGTTVSLGQDPDLEKGSVGGRDFKKIETIDKEFLEAHRIYQENKSSVERQNVDVTKGLEPLHPALRSMLPRYDGVRRDDNSDLYRSLRRSYIKMGDRPDHYSHSIDVTAPESIVQAKKDYVQTRRDFQQIKVLNKYGNIQGAFLGVGATSPIAGGAPIRKSPSPLRLGAQFI
jgi:hypothetical protein